MLVSRLEALAEAITEFSGYRNPEGQLYQLRNPGALRAYDSVRMRDLDGYRAFTSYKGGFDALVTDLRIKCSGRSHTTLQVTSTLRDLIAVNRLNVEAFHIVKFLRRALNDQSIEAITPLEFFLG
jgi:hypothetical protein